MSAERTPTPDDTRTANGPDDARTAGDPQAARAAHGPDGRGARGGPDGDGTRSGGEEEAGTGAGAVTVRRDGPVTTIVLSRPHARNAVDDPTAAALAAAFRGFEADDDAAVAVLHGAGGTFCAGADLKALGTPTQNRVDPLPADGPMGPTRMRLSKPVIAAIAGHAVAGGLELAAWCDLRVAEEDAVLGVFCRRWGVPLIDGGTFRLARLIGESRAMDLVLTGRPVRADEALAIGLVNRVVPRGGALAAAQGLAAELAAFPQACLRGDRAALLDASGLPEDDALRVEHRHGLATLATGEALEGAGRFAGGAGRGGAF
jgi:enoyl-CoA hydratase